MIWLASFPRSGNTFVRNILKENYQVDSSSYHADRYKVREDYHRFPFVKTHLLPHQLPSAYSGQKVVYILRDGRDCIVSLAHYRKDLIDENTDINQNMVEAIQALQGAFFGGWHNHTLAWIKRADVIIRYEDLLKNPLKEIHKINAIYHLPPMATNQVSDIENYRTDEKFYGSRYDQYDSYKPVEHFGKKFFRKGQSGAWKDEMPKDIQDFFWARCSHTMELLGYAKDGSIVDKATFEQQINKIKATTKTAGKVLVDISKMADEKFDGVKRYVNSLVTEYQYLKWQDRLPFDIDLFLHKKIMKLDETVTLNNLHLEYENKLLQTKEKIKTTLPSLLYKPLRYIYLKSNIRKWLATFRSLALEKRWRVLEGGSGLNLSELLNRYDLIHVTLPQHCIFFRKTKTKQLVTVHDLTHRIFPDTHTEDNRSRSETGFEAMIEVGAHVLSVSKQSQKDLEQYYPGDSNRIHRVIYEGVDFEKFGPQYDKKRIAAIRKKYGIDDRPYLFSLFTLEPRKNFVSVIDGFLLLKKENPDIELQLVIGGRKGWKSDKLIKTHPDIRYTGYIEDTDLACLYSDAITFCYLSIYEGFGLPPLEAMACKTPVIYASNSSMKELLGDFAVPVQAKDIPNIAQAMHQLCTDDSYRSQMADRAYRHALSFTWRKCADKTLAFYEELIHNYEKK